MTGEFVVERRFFQCPPTWEWTSDWIIDMRGDVDEEGWSYSLHFGSDKWSGTCQNFYVRRRKWQRLRRPILSGEASPTTSPDPRVSLMTLSQQTILVALQSSAHDRAKLSVLQEYLTTHSIDRIQVIDQVLDQFQYATGKLKAALLFAPLVHQNSQDSQLIVNIVCQHLVFTMDQLAFFKATSIPLDVVHLLLYSRVT